MVISIVMIVLIAILYVIFIIGLFLLINNDIPIYRFKKSLIRAIKYETVHSIEDVYNLYYGARNINKTNNYRHNLNRIIYRLIYEQNRSLGNSNKEKVDETKHLIEKLNIFLKENENISPFSYLPSQEKSLFEDATNYLRHKEFESANKKINEISNLFVVLNDKKLGADKLAKISFVFGLASLLLAIYSVI